MLTFWLASLVSSPKSQNCCLFVVILDVGRSEMGTFHIPSYLNSSEKCVMTRADSGHMQVYTGKTQDKGQKKNRACMLSF